MGKIIQDITDTTILEEINNFKGPFIEVTPNPKRGGILKYFSGKNNENLWYSKGTMDETEKILYTLKMRSMQNVNKIASLALGEPYELRKKISRSARKKWKNEVSEEVKKEHSVWMSRFYLFDQMLAASISFRFISEEGPFKLGKDYQILFYRPEKALEGLSIIFTTYWEAVR